MLGMKISTFLLVPTLTCEITNKTIVSANLAESLITIAKTSNDQLVKNVDYSQCMSLYFLQSAVS